MKIIYKMDKYGQGMQFQFHKLQYNKDLNFMGFTNEMILEMCILSGCDYLPSLPGMGLKRAYSLINKFKTFEKVIKHLRYSSVAVPPLYEESFKKAVWTFWHQRVYDPNKEDIVNLTNITDNIDGDLDFLGPLLPQQIAKAIAKGELDPITKLPFQGENAPEKSVNTTSSQVKDFRPDSNKMKLDLPAQKNVLTNYFCFASLEAKRKFRAPRVSPNDSDSGNDSSPSLVKRVFENFDACKSNDDQMIQVDDILLHNSMEVENSERVVKDNDYPADGIQEQNLLEPSHRSIHKPCIVMRRGHNDEHGFLTVSQKENSQNQRATGKSSYFHQTSVSESDPSYKSSKVTLRSSYFVDKPDDNDGLRTSKKVVIKSSYFKQKSKTTQSYVKDRPLAKDDSISDGKISEFFLPELAAVGNNHDENLYIKRKASSSLNPKEHVGNKHARTDTHVEAKSADLFTDGDKPTDATMPEERFGCKISHLGHYSDVSEKSMERFVSVVSSFKFTSSGSRASGLRAPLKDVKNMYPNRSPAATDFGKFSYMPTSAKIKVKRPSSQRR